MTLRAISATALGSGGTFQGVGRMLKEARPDCKIVLLEPEAGRCISPPFRFDITVFPLIPRRCSSAHMVQGLWCRVRGKPDW